MLIPAPGLSYQLLVLHCQFAKQQLSAASSLVSTLASCSFSGLFSPPPAPQARHRPPPHADVGLSFPQTSPPRREPLDVGVSFPPRAPPPQRRLLLLLLSASPFHLTSRLSVTVSSPNSRCPSLALWLAHWLVAAFRASSVHRQLEPMMMRMLISRNP